MKVCAFVIGVPKELQYIDLAFAESLFWVYSISVGGAAGRFGRIPMQREFSYVNGHFRRECKCTQFRAEFERYTVLLCQVSVCPSP